jgi:hypothetical protein
MVTTALLSFGKTGRQILSTLLIRFSPEFRINKCKGSLFMEISTWLVWSCPSPCSADGNRQDSLFWSGWIVAGEVVRERIINSRELGVDTEEETL